ncbi:hypothetical protein D9613_011343 [Agrocybe pediades]|uniref:Cytochrome P450 n=1 Tax=Agrocybe pediades TaxID=84607 RepID=A0A8H4QSI8_9AGAR|nr:hypothetical protein D9613_011343 [Agrocybe pediades]
MAMLDLMLAFLATGLVYLLYRTLHNQRSRNVAHKPPGPRPWPIVGNLFDMPRHTEWETFSNWAKTYGDVVYVNIVGRPMIILNTLEAANDLLGGRSAIYSDRPYFPLVDWIGHPEFNFGFMPYGKAWKEHKKIFVNGYKQLSNYYDAHYFATMTALRNFRDDPEHYAKHTKLHAGQAIIAATYGTEVDKFSDPLIETAERVMSDIGVALLPVLWIFNPVPLLKHLPNWLGGSYVAKVTAKCKQSLADLQHVPFNQTKSALASGIYKYSFTSYLLQQAESNTAAGAEREDLENTIRSLAAVAYGAASDTTVAAEEIFLLAMALHPEIQERAQKEIDSVIDGDRLPKFEDRERLPYISAIMKETMRWHSPVPAGIPHMLSRDDYYKGHFLPAGSTVVGNIWNILHDPEIFENPMEFQPQRFLSSMDQDAGSETPSKMEQARRAAFGFGRRACPGRLFAEDGLWLLFAQFLSVFSVSSDPKGPRPELKFTSGSLSHPVPFQPIIRMTTSTLD